MEIHVLLWVGFPTAFHDCGKARGYAKAIDWLLDQNFEFDDVGMPVGGEGC